MKTDSTSYTSTTYKQFFAIDSGEYKEKIRFVNAHRRDLDALPLQEYLEVMDGYAEALFEMGRFQSHIKIADHIIEQSIIHNVVEVGEKDLYYETLFQKAASLYNLERTDEAIYILKELLKMDSYNESARLFLINCFVRQHTPLLRTVRKVSLAVIAASAAIILLELVLFRPFIPGAVDTVEITRNVLFVLGAATLIIGEVGVRYKAVNEMYKLVGR